MNLKVGIVGLPNAGKSTLFNALLKRQVADVAPYPFCTIEPNVGVVPVPDTRLAKLAEITKSEEKMEKLPPIIPAVVEFVDIAGLVAGASKGQGLGNKFLSHIREVDVICHVLRFFNDESVVHVTGNINPKRDKGIIETELILADLQTIDKQSEPRGVNDRQIQNRWQLIMKLKAGLNQEKMANQVITDNESRALVSDLHLLTMKPMLYVANVSEGSLCSFDESTTGISPILPISAKIEQELSILPPPEQVDYLHSLGQDTSGLDLLIQESYKLLGLISFLTMGVKEVKAWTVEQRSKAPDAAGVIHTDFIKKFIRAEVISYKELIELGSKGKAKELGKLRLEGKDYQMQDGDVVEFRIGS
jgi:ribosome-binding ATPase